MRNFLNAEKDKERERGKERKKKKESARKWDKERGEIKVEPYSWQIKSIKFI